MKKYMLTGIIAILVLIGLTAAVTDNPENIELKGEKKSAVAFPHKLHQDAGITCQTCHHTMAADAEKPEKACRDCHVKGHKVKPMKAFHNNCIDCHKTTNKEKGTKLPTKCKQCHP